MKVHLQLLHLLLLSSTLAIRHRLYHTDYPVTNGDHDCFYRFENSTNSLSRHLAVYCLRQSTIKSEEKCFGREHTFNELRSLNITSTQLFHWFAPIDLIDDYAVFLRSNDTNKQIYCNCTNGHAFGKHCQYKFVVGNEQSTFGEIVQQTLKTRELNEPEFHLMNEKNFTTCYTHLNCTVYTSLCLDWREIGDGFRHCVNGEDEKDFETMELSDCDRETEYRCRNGLCIPRSFLLDRTLDCPDWYDEQVSIDNQFHLSEMCLRNPAIAECEEHRLGLNFFECGDGQRIASRNISPNPCSNHRHVFLLKALFRPYINEMLNNSCHIKMMHLFNILRLFDSRPDEIANRGATFSDDDDQICPDLFFFPPGPFIFPFVRLLYNSSELANYIHPEFVCWNRSICPIYDDESILVFDHFQCLSKEYFNIPNLSASVSYYQSVITLVLIIKALFSRCTQRETFLSLYQCSNGMQISPYRVLDMKFDDCSPWKRHIEDEFSSELTSKRVCHLPDRFLCAKHTCIPRRTIQDSTPDCLSFNDEYLFVGCLDEFDCQYLREINLKEMQPIIFSQICDGHGDILVANYDNASDTDETDCAIWPCLARYQRCDRYWHRPNGCDELQCSSLIPQKCADNEHPCARFNSTTIDCLPLVKAGDNHIDCLFGTDERSTLLEKQIFGWSNPVDGPSYVYVYKLVCWDYFNMSIFPGQICDREKDCPLGDDELFCQWHEHSTCTKYREFTCKNGSCISKDEQWCNGVVDCEPDGEDERLCDILVPFTDLAIYAMKLRPSSFSLDGLIEIRKRSLASTSKHECHRGIVFENRLDHSYGCLCPSSYYGAHCEFQSERLTVFYRVETPPAFDQRSIHRIVFYLLDENDRVLTYETMIHTVFNEESSLKQLIYLNYPRHLQDRSSMGEKFVRIDIYRVTNVSVELMPLSSFYPVQFSSFLPVTRLVALIYLEELLQNRTIRCRSLHQCQHGHCELFINSGKSFCRCDKGWMGSGCDQIISTDLCQKLNCNPNFSKCVIYNNHGFCLCILGRMGPKCEIVFDACSLIECQNNGSCVSLDERTISHVCVCSDSYFGDLCQYSSAQMRLIIPMQMPYIPMINVHFLHITKHTDGIFLHRNLFFLRNVHRNSEIMINDFGQFYLAPFIFAQVFVNSSSYYGSYYLLALSNVRRNNHTVKIHSDFRCPHVNEFVNSSLIKANWLKRIKFYHLFIKDIRCFYDEIYLCLVDKNGMIDCLIYNHNVANCSDRNYCENGGRCLQKKKLGQLDYACICPQCTTGVFCQIQMNQFSLTLDSLMSQIILTDIPLRSQPLLIKIVLVFISLLFVLGLIFNTFSVMTFRHKTIQKTASGIYLFILSIANQVTITVFVIRVIYLIVNQIEVIGNRQLLKVSCFLFDFILQVCDSLCNWLSACIACERTVNVIKGVHYDSRKSIRMIKFVIPSLFVAVILSLLYQVFSHTLIVDPRSDDRVWCVIQYPYSWLRIYEMCINILSNFVPFIINFISAILLLTRLSTTRQHTLKKDSYRTILLSQIKQHKTLLIAPLVMIVAKLPLIIILLAIKCIDKQWHLYLSLIAYGVSMIPLTSTFAIYVWPAESFMTKFKEQYRRAIRRR